MAVISVFEVAHDRGAGEDEQVRTNERNFIVEVDSALDDPIIARDAPGVPNVNDPHPADPQSFVRSKNTQETDSRLVWFVSVEYSTDAPNDPGIPGGGGDPLKEYPKITWTTRDIEIVAEQAIEVYKPGEGESPYVDPVTNSAFDPYLDPPLVVPDFIQVCTITRNERPNIDYNPDKVKKFQNTINKRKVTIAGRKYEIAQAWLNKYEGGAIQQREGVDFVSVTYQILAARDTLDNIKTFHRFPATWYDTLLDQGLRKLVLNNEGVRVRENIRGPDQKPITEPVNLDGDGNVQILADPADRNRLSVYLRYRTKNFTSFRDLDLPEKYSLTGE